MNRLIVLSILLFPLTAVAQISTSKNPIFQGHNGQVWVATYGCKNSTQETSQLISALKTALAANGQAAVMKGIQEAKAKYPSCVIGTSTDWHNTAS